MHDGYAVINRLLPGTPAELGGQLRRGIASSPWPKSTLSLDATPASAQPAAKPAPCLAAGTQRQSGTRIQVSPQVAADGQTIQIAVNLESTPRDEDLTGP